MSVATASPLSVELRAFGDSGGVIKSEESDIRDYPKIKNSYDLDEIDEPRNRLTAGIRNNQEFDQLAKPYPEKKSGNRVAE